MADNVAFTPGSGGTLATDDIGGVQYPRTKLVHGADGVNNGDVSATNPLPGRLHVNAGGTYVEVGYDAFDIPTATLPVSVSGSIAVSGIDGLTRVADSAVVPGDNGIALLAQRSDAGGALADADGDYSLLQVDSSGRLRTAISASSLPLPTGAATESTLAGVLTTTAFQARTPALGQATMANSSPVVIASNQSTLATADSAVAAKLPSLVTNTPASTVSAPPVRIVGEDVWTCSFAAVGSSVLSTDFTSPIVGTGVGYSQAAGSLLITTGTSTNAEFLTRSVTSWQGSMRLRASIVASQRIAQNNLQITLADLIGEGLAFTIVSATVVNVTKTAHGFTSQNVGQFMNLGGIVGAAGVPGRYAIASIVDANTIQFTVAGWPGSGSGTLTLFGWNHVKNLVTGTTATVINWTTQRRGWADADTAAAINTTASPGTIIQNDLNGRDAFLQDTLRATTTVPTVATRAVRYENLPDDDVTLYVWIWSYNGTSAPATTTTWTLGFISVEKFANTPVYVQGFRANGTANPINANIQGVPTVSVSSISAGTNAIGDVGVQYRANATGAATLANLSSPATPAAQSIKGTAGRLLSITATNSNAATRWLKFWNTASGSVTLGTTAAIAELAIPPNQTIQYSLEGGIAFSTAITMAVTGGQGLTNNTAITLGDVTGLIAYA